MRQLLYGFIFSFVAHSYSAQQNHDFFYVQTCYNISKARKADKQAETYFKEMGDLQPKDHMYYYDIALYFLERKNYTKAYAYMSTAIKHGLSFEMTRNFEINEFDDKHKQLIQKNFLNDRNKTLSYFYVNGTGDLSKFLFMKDLFSADQCARYQLDYTGYDNPVARGYIGYVDSVNIDTLVKFIKVFGMVNTSNVGGDALMNVLLLHLKRYNNSYLDSCIKDNCIKHLLHPSFYTFAIDEQQKRGTTIYGTFNITDSTVFLDIKNVDRLRNSVGMASLYEQSLYQSFKLPKGYSIPAALPKKYEKFLQEIKREEK